MIPLGRAFVFSAGYLLCAFLTHRLVLAQQPTCVAEVDANVVLPDGRLIRGLQREDLAAHVKRETVRINSIIRETGPRRILFMLDTGSDLPRDAKKAEAEVASYIVAQAPVEDSFALITARGQSTEVRFGESREQLSVVLTQVPELAKSGSSEQGMLDALMRAMDWFGNALPGDAIVLMASEIEDNRHAKYSAAAKALADHHIRLFSFLLGPMAAGTVYTDIGINYRGHLSSSSTVVANQENLSALTWNSGGYMLVENAKLPWKEYKLTDAHLDELRHEGWQMYGAVAQSYRVQVVLRAPSIPREGWTLDLSESARKRVPQAKVLYPRELPLCAAPQMQP